MRRAIREHLGDFAALLALAVASVACVSRFVAFIISFFELASFP